MPDEKKIPDVKVPNDKKSGTKTPASAKSETDKKADAPKKDTADTKAAPTKPVSDKKTEAPKKDAADDKAAASVNPAADKKADASKKDVTNAKTPAPAKPDEVKKSDAPKKDTVDSKATSPITDKKTDAPQKDATDSKATAPTKPDAAKKADATKKDATDSKTARPDKSDTDKPPAEEPIDPKKIQIPVGMTETDKVTSVPLSQLHRFEGHPFKVEDNKDMWDLVESIKQFGVMEPAVAIPRKEGGFEIVSGHRRMRACQLAGLTSMPVIVRNLDRDEATINMVDANLKRENISPMEKARAYEMKLEAMKRKAGRRSKMEILSGEMPVRADEQLAQQVGESRATIQRMVRLTKLEPELQNMVDEKKLPVNTAADISYLKPTEQKELADAIKREDKVPSGTQAAEMKKESQAGKLTSAKIQSAVAPTKREQNPELKVTFTNDELRPYFPDKGATVVDVKRGVFDALALRQRALERQKAKSAAKDAPKPKKAVSR